MPSATPKETRELAAVIVKHGRHRDGTELDSADCAEIAGSLIRAGKRLHRLAEHDCNGEMTDRRRDEEKRLMERFIGLCQKFGAGAKFTGDPRGYVARIMFPKGPDGRRPYNTWGGEDDGWGVA